MLSKCARPTSYSANSSAYTAFPSSDNSEDMVKPFRAGRSSVIDFINLYKADKFPKVSAVPLGHIVLKESPLGIEIEPEEFLEDLQGEIYLRLSEIGFILKQADGSIVLPMTGFGNMDIEDHLGWFCVDPVIAEKFAIISQGCEIGQHLEKIYEQEIQKFEPKTAITFASTKNFRNQENYNETKIRGAMVQGDCLLNGSVPSRSVRMKCKQHMGSVLRERIQSDRDCAMASIHKNSVFWGTINGGYCPNKANAYMLFEALLNKALNMMDFIANSNSSYQKINSKYQNKLMRMVGEFLELLFPYAVEITKVFNIKLESKNKGLSSVRFIINNLDTDLENLRDNAKTFNLGKETAIKFQSQNQNQGMASEAPRNKNFEKIEVKGKSLEARITEHEKKVVVNMWEDKVYDLPSEEFVCKSIQGLKHRNAKIFNCLFGEENTTDLVISESVVDLANHFKVLFLQNNIGCADDLFVKIKEKRNDNIGILRSCFVIFGIFPKGWRPKTSEDFEAMETLIYRKTYAYKSMLDLIIK